MLSLRKLRTKLGVLEQAQIVISTAVVVAMITIVLVRLLSRYPLGWFDFTSVIIVGVFGFMIVYFTVTYGRLLEEQKQELFVLKTMAESMNRAVDIELLLQDALNEIRRLLDVGFASIHLVEHSRLILEPKGKKDDNIQTLLPSEIEINDTKFQWLRSPLFARKPFGRRVLPYAHLLAESVEVFASAPIHTKETFAGVIFVADKEKRAMTSKSLELLTGIANQLGVALENATLFEMVRSSEERFIDLFEHAPDMYHIVDRECRIVSCNHTEVERLGYSKDELIKSHLTKLYPRAMHNDVQSLVEQMFESGVEKKGLEEKFVTKKGEIIEVSSNTSIIRDEEGKPTFIRFASRDITEQRKLEAKVIQSQRIDSIGNLAGGISHDFNNILTSILGSTAILKRKLVRKDTIFRLVEIIDTAAKRGAGLTRQLLTFARKGTIAHRPVIVNEIIEETINLFERSTDKSITVEKSVPDQTLFISGDDGQIQQALLNLMINARDAMPDGGTIFVRSKTVDAGSILPEVLQEKSKQYITISIRDTGIGIDPKIQSKIFEPFFTTKSQSTGTGLGLSVVYGVVHSHGGTITMKSEPRKGTEFVMYFPLLQPSEAKLLAKKPKRILKGRGEILIIDDEPQVAEVIGGMLKILGYTFNWAESGKKGLELLRKRGNKTDAVILDLNMPKIGGKEILQKIKQQKPLLPIIISTGYSDSSVDSPYLRDTISGFLQKPYQFEQLSTILKDAKKK